jgi:prepilin-type processing-associated H-X9-DG protein
MSEASKTERVMARGAFLVLLVLVGWLVITHWDDLVERQRPSWDQFANRNNLRQLVLGLINYHDQHRLLPPAAIYSKDGRPLLSWRVTMLPDIEEENLYRQFRLDEPWDSKHNLSLLQRMPKLYARSGKHANAPPGYTYFQAFVGKGTAFEGQGGLRLPDDFPDGASKTILLVEGGQPIPWTKPADIPYDPNAPVPNLATVHEGGFNVGMADGSAKFISDKVSQATLRAAITRNDKDTLGPDWTD